MSFKLGDVIIDRLQFGYGASRTSGKALYTLTQLNEATINVTADTTDIKDKDGNLVYRKYTGKTAELNAVNAFLNFAIAEVLSANSAGIATEEKPIQMPIIQTVSAGKKLDVTGCVDNTFVVNAIYNGAIKVAKKDDEYTKASGETPSEKEFAIKTEDSKTYLIPPTDSEEKEYIVKYMKNVKSGAKITNSASDYPRTHELYFKALAVSPCNKEMLKAIVIHIPEFIPSPELSIALQGGDTQTMNFNGSILANTCSTDKELFHIYFIDEEEEEEKDVE